MPVPPDHTPTDTGPSAGPVPSPSSAASADGPAVRYGPLTLTRYRKDDGRALILYAEDEDGGGVARG